MCGFKKAIEKYGGRVPLAKKLGVTPQAVFKWEKTQLPAARAIQIEQLTNGQITVRELRPDLFQEQAAA